MSDGVTSVDVAAIRARCEAATPGPWRACLGSGTYLMRGISAEREMGAVAIADCRPDWEPRDTPRTDHRPDMEFIAAARTDVPALLDALAATEARVAALEAALRQILPRYAEIFGAAGLGAPAESVAIIVGRAALGDAEAQRLMAANGWDALGEAAPATREETTDGD